MSEYSNDFLKDAGYIRIAELAGERGAHVGEALGMKTALLPDAAKPQSTPVLPKMGA
jgi:hypothetical protein